MGIGAHLNGVLHKSLSSVNVSVFISTLMLLGNGLIQKFTAAKNTHVTVEEMFNALFSMWSVLCQGEVGD
jgi:hypothetical protein